MRFAPRANISPRSTMRRSARLAGHAQVHLPIRSGSSVTGAHKGHAFFAYAVNYLIDTDHGVIVDVEATRAIRQAEVGAAQTMLERTETRFGVKPDSGTADSAYGSAESLAWLVKQKGITPLIPVFDKSNRTDGTFSLPTSPSIPNATATRALQARNWSSFGALTQPHEVASRPRAQDFIVPQF